MAWTRVPSLALALLHVAVLLPAAPALDCYPNYINSPISDVQARTLGGNMYQLFSSVVITMNLPQNCKVDGAIGVLGSDTVVTLRGNGNAIHRADSTTHLNQRIRLPYRWSALFASSRTDAMPSFGGVKTSNSSSSFSSGSAVADVRAAKAVAARGSAAAAWARAAAAKGLAAAARALSFS